MTAVCDAKAALLGGGEESPREGPCVSGGSQGDHVEAATRAVGPQPQFFLPVENLTCVLIIEHDVLFG